MIRTLTTVISRISRTPHGGRYGGRSRWLAALLAGAGGALLPALALAAEEGSRAVARPADWSHAMLLAAAGAIGVLLLATLGALYRRERHLEWDFQKPDPPADHH